MQVSEKQKIIQDLKTENELRTERVIPLLRKMSGVFTEVLDNQGPDEAGVDVIGVSTSPFRTPEYTAFVLKLGNISLKAADRKNNLINIIETQIRQAIRQPLTHPRLPTERGFAHRIVLLTNGTISKTAESALSKAFRQNRDINLDLVGQDRLIESLDQYWPEFYEDRRPFLSTYAKRLFDSLDVVNLEVLGYTNKRKSLSDIYIDSLLSERENINQQDLLVFEKDPITGNQLCAQKKDLVVVTSGPGGGKSTLLKEIAIAQSQNGNEHVAVYLHARDILEAKDITKVAADKLAELSKDKSDDVFEEISHSKLLLLVDGLDELASVEDREEVVGRLRRLNHDKGARVVLGSRPDSNPRMLAALTDFTTYSILPLRYGQIRSFFGKWFKNTDKATKLLEAMKDKGVMDKLPRTPMAMTLVAIVFESKEDLPSNLTELYEMFSELLTGKWDTNRQVTSAFDSPMKVAFLAHLAWIMHSERLEAMSQDRCVAIAEGFFSKRATLDGINAKAFIQAVIDRSHILIPSGKDQIRFSHMTFQEFFCAQWLSTSNPDIKTIVEWHEDDWWQEVLFFYAGKKKDISDLVDALLGADYSNPETRLTRLVGLGAMLQSGFLTSAEKKESAVEFGAVNFIRCYGDLVMAIDSAIKGKARFKWSRVLLIDVLQNIFTSNYTSKYLLSTLKAVFTRLGGGMEGGMDGRFFVANSLARLGSKSELLDFASDPKMVDTAMYLVSRTVLKDEVRSEEEKVKFKKLEKRKETFRSSIKRELRGVLSRSGTPARLKGK